MRHAIVNKDNVVVNVVLWDGCEWLPPRDHIIVQNDHAGIGDIYIPQKNVFKRPNPDIDVAVEHIKQ